MGSFLTSSYFPFPLLVANIWTLAPLQVDEASIREELRARKLPNELGPAVTIAAILLH